MELLDRYLQAVRFWLPRAQQKDIIEELGDDIRSQVEDKESAQGRPLTEDEMVALLYQTGHPMRVAVRYQAAAISHRAGLVPAVQVRPEDGDALLHGPMDSGLDCF